MDNKEILGLVSRVKALLNEIEAAISSAPAKKLTREEYLAKSEDERESYDKEQMNEKDDEDKEDA